MGHRLPVFPRYREPWASCSVCGFDYPRSQIRYHRRFGWQCLWDWDRGPQKDEIYYVPRPNEGTRRTVAPLTNTLTEGDLTAVLFLLRDLKTQQVFQVTFGTEIVVTVSTVQTGAPNGWELNSPWRVFMMNGDLVVTKQAAGATINLPEGINLSVNNDGELVYVL
jgi:hypothetical protein